MSSATQGDNHVSDKNPSPTAVTASLQSEDMNSSTYLLPVSAAALGAFLFGYHLGVVNAPLEIIASQLGFLAKPLLQGMVVSSTLVGALIGSLLGGGFADKFGRKQTMLGNSFFLVLGSILCAISSSAQALIVGRFLAGVGIGINSVVVPIFISESSPKSKRGQLGSLNQIMINLGIVGALIAGFPLASNPDWWRKMFALALIPTLLHTVGIFVSKPTNYADLSTNSDFERGQGFVPGTGSAASTAPAGINKLYLMGMTLFALQQFSGINAVVFYSSFVFKQAGIQSNILASVVVSLVNTCGTIFAGSIIEKAGRKELLSLSFGAMSVFLFLLAASTSFAVLQPYSGPLCLLGTIGYMLAFSLGCGPIPAIVLPELFPAAFRAKGTAMGFASHWFFNIIIGLCFLSVVNTLGISAVYMFFGLVSVLGVVFAQRALPL